MAPDRYGNQMYDGCRADKTREGDFFRLCSKTDSIAVMMLRAGIY